MGQACSMCAILKCDKADPGNGPLIVTPENGLMCNMGPIASIATMKPNANINFGLCKADLNPVVLLGAPKGPCIPVPAGPWIIGAPTIMTRTGPILNKSSKLMCGYGGQITIEMSGVMNVMTNP